MEEPRELCSVQSNLEKLNSTVKLQEDKSG